MPSSKLGIVRVHISPDFLSATFDFAQMAYDVEAAPKPPDRLTRQRHRSFVTAAVLSSVAFLEASINELFYVASDTTLPTSKIPDAYRTRLSAMWAVERFRKGARILEKYQIALKLSGEEEFKQGREPYQSARLLVEIRNALVHYVPETAEIRLDPRREETSVLERKLKNKFKPNPFVPKFPVVSGAQPDRKADYPYFPERCLGYGCAKWASERSLCFADAFFRRIGLTWHYHKIVSQLPKLP